MEEAENNSVFLGYELGAGTAKKFPHKQSTPVPKNKPPPATQPGTTPQAKRPAGPYARGFRNLGNTCYRNAIIQFLATCQFFREGLQKNNINHSTNGTQCGIDHNACLLCALRIILENHFIDKRGLENTQMMLLQNFQMRDGMYFCP